MHSTHRVDSASLPQVDSVSLPQVDSASLPPVNSASHPPVNSTPLDKWIAYGSTREPPAEGKAVLLPTQMFVEKCFNGSNYLIPSDKWFIHPSAFSLPTQMFAEKCFNGSNCLISSDKRFSRPSVFPPNGSADGRRGAPQPAILEPLLVDSQ